MVWIVLEDPLPPWVVKGIIVFPLKSYYSRKVYRGMGRSAFQLGYQALKYYCNEGLIPNVKRDHNNRRIFDDKDIKWIKDLVCLKKCGMSIQEMKEYLALCLEGASTIPQRKEMLTKKQEMLRTSVQELQDSISYIDWKQNFYDEVLSGKRPYVSNLIRTDQ